MRAPIEVAMRPMVTRHRLPKVVGTIWVVSAIVLLRVVSSERKVMVGERGSDLVPDDGSHRGPSNVVFATIRMMRGVIDGAGCHFRLKDRRHRLGFVMQPALHPTELWSVQGRHLDHHGAHIAVVMKKLST